MKSDPTVVGRKLETHARDEKKEKLWEVKPIDMADFKKFRANMHT